MNPMNMLGSMMGGQGGVNPMQLIAQMQRGGNPMQVMQSMVGNNPQFKRVMQMVDGKSPAEMRQVAQNLCQQRGIDFNQALGQLKQMGINVPEDK